MTQRKTIIEIYDDCGDLIERHVREYADRVSVRTEDQPEAEATIDNRRVAEQDYPAARALAEQNGLRLIRYRSTHFALVAKGPTPWRLEVYPGNQRLYPPHGSKAATPHLKLPSPWSLIDVVNAAIRVIRKGELNA